MKDKEEPRSKAENQSPMEATRQRAMERTETKLGRRGAEDFAEQDEHFYKTLVDNTGDGISVLQGGRRVFVNKAYLDIYGLSEISEALGKPFGWSTLPEDSILTLERLASLERSGVKSLHEYRIHRPDGEVRTLQSSSVGVTYSGRPAVLAVIRDITEIKRAQEVTIARTQELETLSTIAKMLAGAGTFAEKAISVLDALAKSTLATRALIRVPEEHGLRLAAMSGQETQGYTVPLLLPYETPVGTAFRQRQVLVINDYPNYPNAIPELVSGGIKSTVFLPVEASGEALGIISVTSTEPGHFTLERVNFLTAIASDLGALLENAKLLESLRSRSEELGVMVNIANILAQPGSFDEKVTAVLDALVKSTSSDVGVLRVPDAQGLRKIAISGQMPQGYSVHPLVSYETSLGTAFHQRRVIVMNDYLNDPRAIPELASSGVGSMILLPVETGGQVLGTISVASMEAGHFTPERVKFLTAIASDMGALLDNARLLESLRSRSEELGIMVNMAGILAQAGGFEGKAIHVLEELVRVVQADTAVLRVPDEKEGNLRLVAAIGQHPEKLRQIRKYTNWQGTSGQAFQKGQLIVANDFPSYPDVDPFWIEYGIRSVVVLPIKAGDRTLGVISVDSEKPNHFTPERVNLIMAITGGIGALLENAGLLESLRLRSEEMAKMNEQLEQRVRELTALNNLFQTHLKERYALFEAYREFLERSRSHADKVRSLLERVELRRSGGSYRDLLTEVQSLAHEATAMVGLAKSKIPPDLQNFLS